MADEEIKRPAMVDWYAPGQLAATGMKTLLSTLLGSMVDTRRIQAGEGSAADNIIDYSDKEEFRFDYMADTGDGWDSTYTMAYLLTRPYIEANGQRLERGDIAILGGDEVYPVANAQEYRERLLKPFKEAPEGVRSEPEFKSLDINDIFLIPGNHDWYDSLGAFSRRFLAYRVGKAKSKLLKREFGQFKTRQVRSYFILKLPHDWEVWALDVQLGHDIDNDQYVFFREHAESIGPETKVILCSAEPSIVSGRKKSKSALEFNVNRITYLAYNRGAKVLVELAGDVHNYQRYEETERARDKERGGRETVEYTRRHIVSGGGGAFLHPTHSYHKGSEDDPRYEPLKRYPDKKTSKGLCRRNLWFAFQHKGMSALLAALYLAMFWVPGLEFQWSTLPLEHPFTVLLMLATVGGFGAFAGSQKGWAWIWGLLHGVGHVALAYWSWAWGQQLSAAILDPSWPAPALLYAPRLLTFLIGFLLSGTLFGIYLWISLNFLRIHHNEGFSSLAWPDHKNFLRCHIAKDGRLKIHVVGVERVASDLEKHPVETHIVEEVRVS